MIILQLLNKIAIVNITQLKVYKVLCQPYITTLLYCFLLVNRCGITNKGGVCLPYLVILTTSGLHSFTESIRGLSVLQMTKQLEYGTGNLAHVLGQ